MRKKTLPAAWEKRNVFFVPFLCLSLLLSSCKKNLHDSVATDAATASKIPAGYSLTPEGLIPDSNMILIEKGYQLCLKNGHAYKIHTATGRIIKDLGEVAHSVVSNHGSVNQLALSMPKEIDLSNANKRTSIYGSGATHNWITYSQWQNTTGQPISSFNTTLVVPAAPTSGTNQNFGIWEGLAVDPATLPLLQPVLIWGSSGSVIGGGQYWTAVNFFLWLSSSGQGYAAYSAPSYNVAVGRTLVMYILCNSQQSDGSYNYLCGLDLDAPNLNITQGNSLNVYIPSNTSATAPFVPELAYAFEVLEIPATSPQITSSSEYSSQAYVSMNNINIQTGLTTPANPPTLNWQSSSVNSLPNGAALGEHSQILDPSSTNGIVSLCFGTASEFINASASKVFQKNNCSSFVGTLVTYTIPSGQYNATTQAAADALAQNDINGNGQNYANATGSCIGADQVQVYATGENNHTGAVPTVYFEVPGTTQVLFSSTINSSLGNVYVPPGTYQIAFTQTDNKSFSVSIPGYTTQSGQTPTFTSVAISGNISIYVTDN